MLCLCQTEVIIFRKKQQQSPEGSDKASSLLQLRLQNVLVTLIPPTDIFPATKALSKPPTTEGRSIYGC